MIQFTLKCAQNHSFDSWFQSAGAYEKLKSSGMVTCAICGTADVEKAIMAPRVRASRNKATAPPAPQTPPAPTESTAQSASQPTRDPAPQTPLSAPSGTAEQALAELKKYVQDNSEYVGDTFASEARAIHDGDAPERPIYGEASIDEAKTLIEDGVQVAPLPFIPAKKTN